MSAGSYNSSPLQTSPPDQAGVRSLVIGLDGPLDGSSSLAIVNRGLREALAARGDVEVLTEPPFSGATHVLRNMYPPRLEAAGVPSYFYFAWEDSRIPSAWAQAFNRHFDGLLVPSTHVRDVVRRSGVAIPVAVVPYGVDDPSARSRGGTARLTNRRFTFLHVSTGFPRKGCDVLVRAFTREFSSSDDVALVIKTLPQYDHTTARVVRRARWRWRAPEIVHIDRDLDPDALAALYASASSLVHPARAEGFGLPIAEAMRAGLPVIASDVSGHRDFCTAQTARLVPCRMTPSRSPFVVEDAMWGEPDEAALRRALREAVEQAGTKETGASVDAARAHVAGFTWPRAAERAVSFIRTVDASTSVPVRGVMLTTWREACGIAEYSRQLIDAMRRPDIEWTILAPHRPATTSSHVHVGEHAGGPQIVRCWNDAWPADVTGALAHIARVDAQVVHLQTHLAIWTAAAIEPLVALARAGRRVFVTLHSVRGATPDTSLGQALARLDRLFVHTDADRRQLAAWGLDENVTVLAQGYPEASTPRCDARSVRRHATSGPVIGTYGFLRPHKGVLEIIRAVARLRRRYPDIALEAITALYPSDDSVQYLDRCRHEAARLGLSERCRFVTDFLEPDECLAALEACDALVLPYATTIDSSSAAVRMAIASRRPVVATRVPVFADVRDSILTVDRRSPRALAAAITSVLEDDVLRSQMAAAADRRLAEHAWSMVGRTYARFVSAAVTDYSSFDSAYPMHSS